ncbi:NAD(P)H-quinone oxidoreductase subunit U, chloroplastic [Salvia miltiorrhiza]|uniref:NAD(P)H-quinone oxidoreductase subunit U, chloroplastic n=1 Tax=Salvia miltiorrhiza TaxID=226208 RepID=UPI0025ACED3A|nr:NAD(P)H-quinone oxidoreductase subunit U, chloroplastic [Salvia miltiorrhiza]
MAAAASPATVASSAYYAPAQKRVSIEDYRVRILPCSHARRRRRSLVVRSSGEESATTAVDEANPQPPAEVPKGPPSLISTLNVEKALRGIAITDADHYGRLGLRSKCSYNEVNVAYKSKMAELTSKELDEEELSKELELLKESHSVLSSAEERRLYDWSLARSGKPDTYMWPFEVDITQAPIGDPPPQEPEDEWPTTLTGYFFLGWMVLSFVLFITLNR